MASHAKDESLGSYIASLRVEHGESLVVARYGSIVTKGNRYFRKTFWDRDLAMVRLELDCMRFLAENGVKTLEPHPNFDEAFFEIKKNKTTVVGHKTRQVNAINNKGTTMVELARVSSTVVSALRSYTIDRGERLIGYLPQIDVETRSRACIALVENYSIRRELRHHVVEALSALLENNGQQTVVHGDLGLRNMLLEEKTQSLFVFDFSDIGYATLEYELGRLVSTIAEREDGTILCRELLGCLATNGVRFDHKLVVANAHLHKAYLSVLLENEPLDVETLATIAAL